MRITWDPEKAEENLRKHGVVFGEGKTVFNDPLARAIDDPDHSWDEPRFLKIGESTSGRTIVVCYAIIEDGVRLIHARLATSAERRRYMRGDEIRDEAMEDEIRAEYDFSHGVRGKHYFPSVNLDEDVAAVFPDEKAVNDALRSLMGKRRARR